MGLMDSITQKVEGEAMESMIENQAKSFFSGSSSSSSDNQEQQSGDNQSSSSNNQYVNKIESFIGQERVDQIKNKVGADNFAKAESAIESQIESRFK